jgi:hypothetical protein
MQDFFLHKQLTFHFSFKNGTNFSQKVIIQH